MSGIPRGDAGLASGLFNTTQQIGGALGVAVLSSLAAARAASVHAAGSGNAAALTSGYRLTFTAGTVLAAVAVIVAAALLRAGPSPKPSTVTTTAR